MNAQSNQLEYAFKRSGIPYKVVGGMKFFDRAEVKDMLSYLCVISNSADDLRLRRIINNPPRGIGVRTIEVATALAQEQGVPLFEVVRNCLDYADLQKAAAKLNAFAQLIEDLQEKAENLELLEFYQEVLKDTGYLAALEAKNTVESRSRIENVKELSSSMQGYLENNPEGDLDGFLDEVALYTVVAINRRIDRHQHVVMYTVRISIRCGRRPQTVNQCIVSEHLCVAVGRSVRHIELAFHQRDIAGTLYAGIEHTQVTVTDC
jgi:DNA helicase-2/ATP-dependent DNA helicase PcrA